MKKILFFALLLLFGFETANAQDCPRIFTKGDTLYTDPAPRYQWFNDDQAIPGATKQWYLPAKKGNYAVEIWATSEVYRYCPLLDSAALAQKPVYSSLDSAINAQEVVAKLMVINVNINQDELLLITDRLPCLQFLNVNSNQLASLPESIGQLTNLQMFYLHNNQLTSLPESIGQLTQLQFLDLHGNQLTSLPESIGQLTKLGVILLSYNQLTSIPETIGQLTQLDVLYGSYNQLTSLPESIGQLTQLRGLLLNFNQLKRLPESIANLKDNLKFLELSGNPIPAEEQAKIRAWLPNTSIKF